MTTVPRWLAVLAGIGMLAACGAQPSSHSPTATAPSARHASPSGDSNTAAQQTGVPGAAPTASGLPDTILNPGTVAPQSHGVGATPTPPGKPGSTPRPSSAPPTPNGGSCPDPRYCADYVLVGPTWSTDGAGRAVIHYRVNPSHPAAQTTLTDAQVVNAVQRTAQTLMADDPSIVLTFDGTTTDVPANFNGVIGFGSAGGGMANIQLQPTPDDRHFSGFDVELNGTAAWSWQPCDGASTACTPYAGTGTDLGAILTHVWFHVVGISDIGADQDRLLTNYGGIASGPDCGQAGPICRFAVTPGLGDVLGVRHMYPTSAAMPTLYYDE